MPTNQLNLLITGLPRNFDKFIHNTSIGTSTMIITSKVVKGINFTNTKDGAGRITGLTSKALIEASQTRSNDTPNKIGGKTILVLVRAD